MTFASPIVDKKPRAERVELSPAALEYIATVGPIYAELISGRLGSFAGYAIDAEPDGSISMRVSYCSRAAFEAVLAICQIHLDVAEAGTDVGSFSFQRRDDRVEVYVDGAPAGSIPIPKEEDA